MDRLIARYMGGEPVERRERPGVLDGGVVLEVGFKVQGIGRGV